jgi:hypothetical protein
MKKYISLFFIGFMMLQSCSRKTVPTATEEVKTTDVPLKKVNVYKPPVKTPVPKMIVVNDKAATKTLEGRYYYDLEGKRYWRNKADGKYYLYYKGIFENKNFQ